MDNSIEDVIDEATAGSEISEDATRPNTSGINSEISIHATDVNQQGAGENDNNNNNNNNNDNNAIGGAQPDIETIVLRGVRVRTGCNTCRKRHVKCDERKPICLNCSKGKRDCVFPTVEALFRSHTRNKSTLRKNDDVAGQVQTLDRSTEPEPEPEAELYEGWDASSSLFVPGVMKVAHLQNSINNTAVDTYLLDLATVAANHDHEPLEYRLEPKENLSPEVSSSLKGKEKARQQVVTCETPAFYATQESEQMEVENSFLPSLYPQRDQAIKHTMFHWPPTSEASADNRTYDGRNGSQGPSSSQDIEPNSRKRRRLSNEVVKPHKSPVAASVKVTAPLSLPEKQYKGVTGPLPLSPDQAHLFRNYVENLAPELDIFDFDRHFAQTIPRLTRRKEALLHACLAFSGKSVYLTGKTGAEYDSSNIPTEVSQYYDMALRDMQSSLISATNNNFEIDQSMLATAVLLSAFDNLEGGGRNFIQHAEAMWSLVLRPSFANEGGVKQAVFWSFFAQDVVTAFFAKRKTYLTKDFWQIDSLQFLRDDELARRIVYIAAQIVNFCFERPNNDDVSVIGAKSQLLELELIKWKKALPETFEPLVEIPHEAGLKELWFTLPLYGVALQIYHWAYIILIMHRPIESKQDYVIREQRYRQSSPYIIGVSLGQAKKTPMWISIQCLLLAGLVILNEAQRNVVQGLIQGCQTTRGYLLGI